MAGFDYSKWDNIELSDDESDLHPNIDKDSWFRLKHRTRVEREAKEAEEKAQLEDANARDGKRAAELVAKLSGAGFDAEEDDRDALQGELEELRAAVQAREDRLAYMEKHKKLNVDNICYVAEERTIIAGGKEGEEAKDSFARDPRAKTEEEEGEGGAVARPEPEGKMVKSYAEFTEQHEALLERYSEVRSLEDTKAFLHSHGAVLLHEHGQSYMLLSCLEDEMNGKRERMKHVARQCQILTNISELAVSMGRHPRDVVLAFFARIENPQFGKGFEEAVQDFIVKIQKRAVEKRKEMDAQEAERGPKYQEVELSPEERTGPGGLDPVEVFESLPQSMQEAFESRVIEKLHEALRGMPPAEAEYHMKRCVDSGLWNPGPSGDGGEEEEEEEEQQGTAAAPPDIQDLPKMVKEAYSDMDAVDG